MAKPDGVSEALPSTVVSSQSGAEALQNVTRSLPTGLPPEATVAVTVNAVPSATGDVRDVVSDVVVLLAAPALAQQNSIRTDKDLPEIAEPRKGASIVENPFLCWFVRRGTAFQHAQGDALSEWLDNYSDLFKDAGFISRDASERRCQQTSMVNWATAVEFSAVPGWYFVD